MDEYDEKVFHSFRLILREVANVYVSVHGGGGGGGGM